MPRTPLGYPILLAAIACGPTTSYPPTVMAIVPSSTGAYVPTAVELDTLTDVVAMKGQVATLIGGARIVIDPADPLLQTNGGNLTDDQLAQIFLKSKGIPPRGSYIENGATLWPADFHTWNMVSTYYNFEKAFAYFQGNGVRADEMNGGTIYYFPELVLMPDPKPQADNALFFSAVQAFLVLPFNNLQQVPLAMNFGVMSHEFSHRVFNRRVYLGKSYPDALVKWNSGLQAAPPFNTLKSIDEGLADFHGVGATCLTPYGCDTRFLAASLGSAVADARDMNRPGKCMTAGLLNGIGSLSADEFNNQLGLQYQVGTIFDEALWHTGQKTNQLNVIQKSLLAAYDDPSPSTPGLQQFITQNLETSFNFTLTAAMNIFLSHITDAALRSRMCSELSDHLQIPIANLNNCQGAATGTECPPIQ